jgi:hypothetical protein
VGVVVMRVIAAQPMGVIGALGPALVMDKARHGHTILAQITIGPHLPSNRLMGTPQDQIDQCRMRAQMRRQEHLDPGQQRAVLIDQRRDVLQQDALEEKIG